MSLFSKLEREAWGGFLAFQSRMFRLIEDDLREHFQLTHAEFEVLLRLAKAPGHRARIQALAEASLLTRSGTSRLVDRLVKVGWVERLEAEEDRRGAYAVMTERGLEHFFKAAEQHVALVRREFLQRLTPEDQAVLAAVWRRLNAPAEEQPLE